LGFDITKNGFKLRAQIVERFFAHVLGRGGMRRTHLRGRENVQKRYLLHVAGHNLSLMMRQIIGSGTPKEVASAGDAILLLILVPDGGILLLMMALTGDRVVYLAVVVLPLWRS